MRRAPVCSVAALAVALRAGVASAEAPRAAEAPASAWLDLRPAAPGAPPQVAPAWLEAVEYLYADEVGEAPPGETPDGTVIVRLRLLPTGAADAESLLLRLIFDDAPAGALTVTAWNELGQLLWESEPLTDGLRLPNAKSVLIPARLVNYLEVRVPGDGARLRAAFLSWMRRGEVLHATDRAPVAPVQDPFRAGLVQPRVAEGEDSARHGVVSALLEPGPVALDSSQGRRATVLFDLDRAPLGAVLRFDVLGADLAQAPVLWLNGRLLGAASWVLPDLADPGLRGELSEGSPDMGFRYSGWLPALRWVPTLALTAGRNRLEIALPEGAADAALRRVQIQLKYAWDKFDHAVRPGVVAVPPAAPTAVSSN